MDLTPDELIGRNIAALRRAAGMTQERFAEATTEGLGFEWRSRQTITEIESGRRHLQWHELLAVAAYFEVSPRRLILGPGADAYRGIETIRVGDRSMAFAEWIAWWDYLISYPEGFTGPAQKAQRAIDKTLKGRRVDRPWATFWRRNAGGIGTAFERARQKAITRVRRYPGPIYVLTERPDGDVTTRSETAGQWGVSVKVELRWGQPYVARDELEAEVLGRWESRGGVRRISRQEAYRLRQRWEGGSDGMDQEGPV